MSQSHAPILNRLIDTGHADDPWALIVPAAMEGDADLEAFLDKPRAIDLPKRSRTFPHITMCDTVCVWPRTSTSIRHS